MQLILELGHDSEVAATAADGPGQVGILLIADAANAAVCRDDLRRIQVIDRQAELAIEAAEAAAQRIPADAGVRNRFGCRDQTVLACCAVEP